jgi:hypothetical protein
MSSHKNEKENQPPVTEKLTVEPRRRPAPGFGGGFAKDGLDN